MARAATQPQAAASAAAERVEVKLVRGTFTDRDENGETVNFGPGSTVLVTADDLAALKRLGLVRGDDYVPPDEVQDGQLKISAADGPTVATVAVVS